MQFLSFFVVTIATVLLSSMRASAYHRKPRHLRFPKPHRRLSHNTTASSDSEDRFENISIGISIPDVANINIGGCFSELSTVELLGGEAVAMKDLRVGDHILTGDNVYEPVYAFGHWDMTTIANFIQIQSGNDSGDSNVLEVTGDHLVFVDGKLAPMRADNVKVGDVLQGFVVQKIGSVRRNGLYAPLTPSGTLMVNGAKVSSYISLQNSTDHVKLQYGIKLPLSQHSFIHTMLSPFRMICQGASPSFCHSYDANGMPHFISYGIQLAHYCESLSIVVQVLLFTVFVLLGGTFMVLESLYCAVLTSSTLICATGLVATMRALNIGVRAKKLKGA